MWQEYCSYKISLSEVLECGFSREVGEQIVPEARKVDNTGYGYRLDKESHIPLQSGFHHTQ